METAFLLFTGEETVPLIRDSAGFLRSKPDLVTKVIPFTII